MALNGGARHLYYLSPAEVTTALKFNWTADTFAIIGFGTGKISTALLILRIMGPTSKWRKWFLYVNICLTIVFTFLSLLFTLIQCNPTRALWEKVPGARCWDPKINSDYQIFSSSNRSSILTQYCYNRLHAKMLGWNCFFDLSLALMPITIVWNLNMKMRRKIALCTTLGLGVL